MCQRAVRLSLFSLILAPLCLHSQDFKIDGREIQIHGFASQGFVHTDDNNWLTMQTSNVGSGEFSDFGVNASTQITDRFRVGAQLYDRNLGDWEIGILSSTGPTPSTNSSPGWASAEAASRPSKASTPTRRTSTSCILMRCSRRASIPSTCAIPPSLTTGAICLATSDWAANSECFHTRFMVATTA